MQFCCFHHPSILLHLVKSPLPSSPSPLFLPLWRISLFITGPPLPFSSHCRPRRKISSSSLHPFPGCGRSFRVVYTSPAPAVNRPRIKASLSRGVKLIDPALYSAKNICFFSPLKLVAPCDCRAIPRLTFLIRHRYFVGSVFAVHIHPTGF
jgi:hypothetical protein